MTRGNGFVLDSDVLIDAHQRHYAFDICPGFWMALTRQHKKKTVCSIDRVKDELLNNQKDDLLSEWAKESKLKSFFKGTSDQRVITAFGQMMNWVQQQDQYTAEAKSKFASAADGWVIAFAMVNNVVVVTHEVYAPGSKTEVKIPNVCVKFEVPHCDSFEMLRTLREKFVLKSRRRTKS